MSQHHLILLLLCVCFNHYYCENPNWTTGEEYVQEIVCERNFITLCCLEEEFIRIIYTNYGRTVSYENKCLHGRGNVKENTTCYKDVTSPIEKLCDKKLNWTIFVINQNMGGDPCIGTYKYLNITYICVKNITKPIQQMATTSKHEITTSLTQIQSTEVTGSQAVSNADKQHQVNLGVIVGIIGVLLFLFVPVIVVALILVKRRKNIKDESNGNTSKTSTHGYNNANLVCDVNCSVTPQKGYIDDQYTVADKESNTQNNKLCFEDGVNLNTLKTCTGNLETGRSDQMVDNTYYDSSNIVQHASQQNNLDKLTDNTYYEGGDVIQPLNKLPKVPNGMIENTYYQSSTTVSTSDYDSKTAGNGNYIEILPKDEKINQAGLTENTYYQGQDKPEEPIIYTSNGNNTPQKKHDEGNYVYTYGHFKLEGRQRAPPNKQ